MGLLSSLDVSVLNFVLKLANQKSAQTSHDDIFNWKQTKTAVIKKISIPNHFLRNLITAVFALYFHCTAIVHQQPLARLWEYVRFIYTHQQLSLIP